MLEPTEVFQTQPFVQNLSVNAIVEQVLLAKDVLNDWHIPTKNHGRYLTNIVFMGMGEPLYNTDNVLQAIEILSADDGLGYGRRRITVSTAGIVPEIPRLAQAQNVSLAVSLHATNNVTRSRLMPINERYPIEELIDVCRDYTRVTNRPVTFEYVLLNEVNDSLEQANALLKLVLPLKAKVNLIPFNPWEGSIYQASPPKVLEKFANILRKGGVVAPIRRSRGHDIMAACGQLKSDTIRKRSVRKGS